MSTSGRVNGDRDLNDGTTIAKLRVEQLKARLQLIPHPEGGSYARMYASALPVLSAARTRPAATAIWYLMGAGQCSLWHVVDTDEIWHHIEGETIIVLVYAPTTGIVERHRLGPFDDQAQPFLVVPAGCWQAVLEVAEYALCSCVVTPGFEFHGFSLIRDLADQRHHFDGALSEFEHLL